MTLTPTQTSEAFAEGETEQGSEGRNARKGVPSEADFATARGGEADGKRALGKGPAFCCVAGGGFAAAGVLIPKSVLAVRQAPERLACSKLA